MKIWEGYYFSFSTQQNLGQKSAMKPMTIMNILLIILPDFPSLGRQKKEVKRTASTPLCWGIFVSEKEFEAGNYWTFTSKC